jgi:hypothetical protein
MPPPDATEFRSPRLMTKLWGSARPDGLRRIFSELASRGFKGPISWSDPSRLSFDKDLGGDLFARVVLTRLGELPKGSIHFDSDILVCSRFVAGVEIGLDLWQRDEAAVEYEGPEPYSVLLAVSLSHLKWCEQPEDSNPKWTISNSDDNADDWIETWRRLGEQFVLSVAGPLGVAQYLMALDHYKRPTWVKSSGPVSSARYEYAAILLAQVGDKNGAQALLLEIRDRIEAMSSSGTLPRPLGLLLRRINLIASWVASGH